MEIWKDIKGHRGYQISNLGRVRSLKPSKNLMVKGESILKVTYQRGEACMILNHYSKEKLNMARLVLEAFQPQ